MADKRIQRKAGEASTAGMWGSGFDRLSPLKKDLVCAGLMLLLVYVLFWQVISPDRVLGTGGDTIAHQSWVRAIDHIRDTEGIEPLWVPYIYGGMPVFGSLLFPRNVNYIEEGLISVASVIFAFSEAHYFLLHVFLSGLFMYLLVRTMKFPPLAGLLAGCVYLLNPYAIGLGEAYHWGKLAVFSYIPLLFLLVYRLMEKRDLLTFSLLAATAGTMFLNKHPQMAFYGMLLVGGYLAYEIVPLMRKEPGRALTTALLFAAAIAIGMAVYSYELLPTKEYAEFSVRGGGGEGATGGANYDWATGWSLHPFEMLNYVIPSFFGFSSQVPSDWQGQPMNLPLYWGWMPFTDSPPYIGIVPLVLALFALAYRRNRMTWFLTLFSVLVFFISFGNHLPLVYDLFYDFFPYFNKFRAPSMILYLIPFTVGILGVIGLAWIIETGQKGGRDTGAIGAAKTVQRWIAVMAGVFVLAFIGKQLLFDLFSGSMFVKPGEEQQYNPQVIAMFREKRFDLLWKDLLKISAFVILLLAAVLAYLKRRIGATAMSMAMVALLVVDLVIIDVRFINPRPKSDLENSMKPDATMQFLMADSGVYRVLALEQNLFRDNTLMSHQIQSVSGYSPAKLRIYQELIDSALLHPTGDDLPVNMHVVDMLNTKYVVAGGMLPPDRFQQVYSDPATKLMTFRNLSALPRAWFVDTVVVAESKSARYAFMNSPDWDPARVAVLDEKPAAVTGRPDSSSVVITYYGAHRITMETFSTTSALLVLGEVYYPAGWKAAVDGQETGIFRTNAVLRSVVVPGGNHTVEFTFDPPTYELGSTITNFGWAAVVLLLLAGAYREPRIRRLVSGKGG